MASFDRSNRVYIDPIDISASNPSVENPVPVEILHQWRNEGYALVDGLLPQDLVTQARAEVQNIIDSRPDKVIEDFGGFSWPFEHAPALNSIVLHPTILSLARIALQDEIHLIQGEAWMKKSTSCKPLSNQDQRMHMDYPNHTLTHPSSFDRPEVIAMILYFDDSTDCGGETSVAPREGPDDPLYQMPYNKMPGTQRHHWLNDRTTTEEYFKEHDPEIYDFRQRLYQREKFARFNKGSMLLYRHDVYHRGTPILPGKTRIVMNLAYKRAACTWITNWQKGWATDCYGILWGVVPTLTEDQQAALGIPRASHSYWKEGENLTNYLARYHQQAAERYE